MSFTRTQVVCLLWLVLAAGAAAQEQAGAPAAPATPAINVAPDQAAGKMAPDTRPLTGAQTLTLGTSDMPSFLVPRLHFAQTVDSNPNPFVLDPDVGTVTSITGELELQRVSRSRSFTMKYQGGGLFYANGNDVAPLNQSSSNFQRLGMTQKFNFGRWSLLLSDETSYASSSPFGGGTDPAAAFVGPDALAGGNLAGLNPTLVPAQNLLTQVGSQINSSAVAEADYILSGRSTITFTGNYGLLRSPDGNLLDSNQEGVGVGYNRNLTARDTVGISYGFTQFGYVDVDTRMRNHIAQLLYGRRVTGRLSLAVGGGGGIMQVRTGAVSQNLTLWNAQASLHYLLHHNDFTAAYARAVNAGSGVQPGTNSDVLSGGFSRPFLRRWLAATSVGYTHNSAVIGSADSYTTFFANAAVQRRLGLYNGVFASYSFQRQAGLVFCAGCGDQSLRHLFTVGFDWGFRPIRME